MFPIISNMRYNSRAITTGARWVQTCLKKIGYYKGVIDGMYGQGLEDAVKKIPGVIDARVNFLTQKLTLTAPDDRFDEVLQAVVKKAKHVEPDTVIHIG